MSDVKLTIKNISKAFPGVQALNNVSFEVKRGVVHAICGENGAGKSTLMKIINGIYRPDSGEILIDGKAVTINSPIHARKLGIAMIHQELNYMPEITVEESFFVGNWPKDKYGKVNWREIRERTLELLKREGLHYSPTTKLKDLSISDIQMLEILKAVSYNSEIIIMDEPTSAITQKEVDILFNKIRDLKAKGVSIIYISHKLDEVFEIADQITILRDGVIIETRNKEDYDMETVISQMVGRKMENNYPKEEVEIGEKILEVKNFSSSGKFKDVNFYLRKGEIVGFAGLMGAGRTEVMRALYGLDPYDTGEIIIEGKNVKINSAKSSIENNMIMLSEDRRRYGIIPVRDIKENVSLSSLKKFIYKGHLHKDEEIETVTEYCNSMNVKAPTLETLVENLSGGNQQKVILAKCMMTDPKILIMDEPTRGIDVGAKYEIYKLMVRFAKEGKGLIMVSSELPELIGMCDRIYVMARGKIVGELQRGEFSQERIMKHATALNIN